MVLQSLQGLPAFIAYFCLATALVIAFLLIYTRITPMNEFELIRKNVPGAAIALRLSLFSQRDRTRFRPGRLRDLGRGRDHRPDHHFLCRAHSGTGFFEPERSAAGDVAPAIWLGFTVRAGRRSCPRLTEVVFGLV